MKFFAGIFLIFGAWAAAAQTPCALDFHDVKGKDSIVSAIRLTPARATLTRAFEFSADEQIAPAVATARQSLHETIQAHDLCGEAASELALGRALLYSKPREALPSFARAEDLFLKADSRSGLAITRMEAGIAYWQLGEFEPAIQSFTLAETELRNLGMKAPAVYCKMKIFTMRGGEVANVGDLQAALAELDNETSALAQSYRILVLASLGTAEQRQGNSSLAFDYFQQAIRVLHSCNCALGQGFRALDGLALLEISMGRPQAALQNLKLAGTYLRRSRVTTFDDTWLMHQARAYNDLHEYTKAAFFYERALSRATPEELFIYPFIQSNLGSIYLRLGQRTRGLHLLQEASTSPQTGDGKCVLLGNLGDAYLRTHEPQRAEQTLSAALDNCRMAKANDLLAEILALRARARLQQRNIAGALEDVREAQANTEAMRSSLVPTDAYRLGYEQRVSVYDIAVQVYLAAHRDIEALEASEQGRARALLDLLDTVQHRSGAPAATNATDRTLSSDAHVNASTFAEMQAAAERLHSALLSYWVSTDSVHLWVLRPGQPLQTFTTHVKQTEIERLVQATRRPGAPQQTWTRLYRILIAPAEGVMPKERNALLTIVPHGALFEVSFAALLDPHGRYLVEQYALHTVPSVGLLRYSEANASLARTLPAHFLFLAAPQQMPTASDGHRLPALPGTTAEVNAIVRLLPAGQVERLQGLSANRENLESHSQAATMLHLATHAVLNDEDSAESYLALDDTAHDGKLKVADIYALHLHSNLVVLSACSTGRGKITGDGIAGMGRAFFYAGAASVVSTLWDVPDQPLVHLLPRFYQELSAGERPSAALRSAQLAMLADLRRGRLRAQSLSGRITLPPDPFYWAAFSLAGEP